MEENSQTVAMLFREITLLTCWSTAVWRKGKPEKTSKIKARNLQECKREEETPELQKNQKSKSIALLSSFCK